VSGEPSSDESAGAQRIVAWAFLVAFVVLTSIGRAVLFAAGAGDSPRFVLAMGFGFPWLVWVWLVSQGRPHRAAFPLDLGLFVLVAWPFVASAYLWRFEGWRGLGKVALVLALYPLGYALTLVAYYGLAALLALRGNG
jgi:hypothetical protein